MLPMVERCRCGSLPGSASGLCVSGGGRCDAVRAQGVVVAILVRSG